MSEPLLENLLATVKDIDDLIRWQLIFARGLPAEKEKTVRDLRITPGFVAEKDRVEIETFIHRLKDAVATGERKRGEILRDHRLREIAAKLEAYRAALPDLAARVSIALGVVARDIAAEAGVDLDELFTEPSEPAVRIPIRKVPRAV